MSRLDRQDFAPLTWKEKERRFLQMARETAVRFGLENMELELVGDMEGYPETGGLLGSFKYRVTTDADHLLNIYYVFSGDPDPTGFDRRLAYTQWVDHVADHGIRVQRRRPDRSLELMPRYRIDLDQGTSVDCTAVLTDWIPGAPLSDTDHDDIRSIAILMAKMHDFTTEWKPPRALNQTFTEITLGTDWERAPKAVADGRVRSDDYDAVDTAMRKVIETLSRLPKDTESWGVIHGDLTPKNCIRSGDQICPIDLDGTLTSWYLFDLMRGIADLAPSLRQTFVDAYTQIRPLPSDATTLLEAMIVAHRLHTWARWVGGEHTFDWVPAFIGRECDAFLNDRPFLYTLEPTVPQHH